MSGLHPQFWWWVARATGIVAWAAATAAVAWGVTMSGRLVRRRRLPAWLLDLHRYLGTLTLAFVAVHILALVADSYTTFGLRETFVPMASEWRPGAVTWGVFALYGMLVVQVTSWGMRFLPRQAWHGIHLISYLVFVSATVHAALSGADRQNPLAQGLAVVGVTMVITLTLLRVLSNRPDAEPARTGSAGVAGTAGGDPASDRAAKIAAAKATMSARKEAVAPESAPTAATASVALPPPSPADRLDGPVPAAPDPAVLHPGSSTAPDRAPASVILRG